ncbi:MAG: type II secretion system protein GspM [Gammaproteobacteria bacterium]
MTLWLRDLMDRYDQLSLRERILVLVATTLMIALVWNGTFIVPLDKERKSKLGQVDALRAEITGLEQSIEALVAQGATEDQKPSHATADALQAEIADIDRRLAGVTSGLIAPKEMSHVLEQVLARAKRMTLIGLHTLPPEAVIAPGSDVAQPGARGAAQIYKHGVELVLSGSYVDTLYFLQALEALPWRFLWDRVEYSIEYPKGTLKLRVYTLGLDEGWIGV